MAASGAGWEQLYGRSKIIEFVSDAKNERPYTHPNDQAPTDVIGDMMSLFSAMCVYLDFSMNSPS